MFTRSNGKRRGAGGPLAATAPERVGLSSERLERIGTCLDADIAQGRMPGAVVLIARDGKIAYWEAFGKRTPGGPPMERNDLFRIYSMTKPIVSVAAMMLAEEGRLLLSDPIGKYIPALAKMEVAVAQPDGRIALEPARAEISIQDLLRHTSGLTYSFRLNAATKAYADGERSFDALTNREVCEVLGTLPLAYQPGSVWEYGRSTDVMGHLVEVLSGRTLGEFLRERILDPLGMRETAFHVPEAQWHRICEPGPVPGTDQTIPLANVRQPPRFESGGGGLVSTAADYIRFAQMLANGGELDGTRLLSPKTLAWMTADHLGSIPRGPVFYPGKGYGFGLGFAVRLQEGISSMQGSAGDHYWTGAAGTSFWVDPRERIVGLMMVQLPPIPQLLLHYWWKIRSLTMQAICE